MPQYDVTLSGTYLKTALVTPENTDPAQTLGFLVARGLQSVTNLAALRTWDRKGPPVYVESHTTRGDNGGGIFIWDAADNSKMVASATIASGGTGYVAGSTVFFSTAGATSTITGSVYITSIGAGGAVTGIMVVRWGRYTVTPANPVATTSNKGSGLTLNVTWANCDNNGSIISPAGTSAGRWLRQFNGWVDIRWFGALTTGDAQPSIQRAVAYHSRVHVPPGTFGIYNPIVLFDERLIEGDNPYTSEIYGSSNNIGNPLIAVNAKGLLDTEAGAKRVEISRLGLSGYCTSAIVMNRGTYCIVDQVRIHNTFNTDHAFLLDNCWNTHISNIHFTATGNNAASGYTPPPGLACMWIGVFNGGLMVENMITSSTNAYGILMEGFQGKGASQYFNGLTIQGHTEVGVYLRNNSSGPTYVHGLYTENCKVSMRLGDDAGSEVARAVHLSGCSFASSEATNQGYAPLWLDYVHGVDISGCTFGTGNTLDNCAILFNTVHQVRIMGGCYWGSYPVDPVSLFRRYSTLVRVDVQMFNQSTDTGTRGGQLVMRPNLTGSGNYDKIVKLVLDANGAWVPTVTTIPVHASLA